MPGFFKPLLGDGTRIKQSSASLIHLILAVFKFRCLLHVNDPFLTTHNLHTWLGARLFGFVSYYRRILAAAAVVRGQGAIFVVLITSFPVWWTGIVDICTGAEGPVTFTGSWKHSIKIKRLSISFPLFFFLASVNHFEVEIVWPLRNAFQCSVTTTILDKNLGTILKHITLNAVSRSFHAMLVSHSVYNLRDSSDYQHWLGKGRGSKWFPKTVLTSDC